MDNCNSTNRN